MWRPFPLIPPPPLSNPEKKLGSHTSRYLAPTPGKIVPCPLHSIGHVTPRGALLVGVRPWFITCIWCGQRARACGVVETARCRKATRCGSGVALCPVCISYVRASSVGAMKRRRQTMHHTSQHLFPSTLHPDTPPFRQPRFKPYSSTRDRKHTVGCKPSQRPLDLRV